MTRQRHTSQKIKPIEDLKIVHPHAAGLDIGAREIWACVPAQRTAENVRVFGTFTVDLQALADWLIACGVDTVAMESTGVYWIPVFELLEARGLKVYLVNSWHLKHVPGRKSDVLDCQWIQQLHSLGLLRASFRPDAEMCALRAYLRHRAALLQHRAPHVLHMQKALQQMNVQLPLVLSDIMGETGQKIIRAIVAGERDPLTLAQLRHPSCKSREDEIAKALTGTWQPEHLFALKQSLELVDFYTHQLAQCDAELARQFAAVQPRWDVPAELPLLPKTKPGSRSKNQPAYHARAELFRITGVDLVAVEGISASLAQTIITEVGTDMNRFPTEKHFCSWLGLSPHHEISGARSCVTIPYPPTIARVKPFARPRPVSSAATVPSGPSTAARKPNWVRCKRWLPLPTRSLAPSITCSNTRPLITTLARRCTSSTSANGRSPTSARKPSNSALP